MRNSQCFLLLALLFATSAARAALVQEGSTLVVSDEANCSYETGLGVEATPKGAFEVVWVDDWDYAIESRRFDRNLTASPQVDLLPYHGGMQSFDFQGDWVAGKYEWAVNLIDDGVDPDDPWASYRFQLDAEGDPLAPPARIEPRNFFKLTPAKDGESLRLRFEPPIFGPVACQSMGLLGGRIDMDGALVSKESRITAKASPWSGFRVAADRLTNDSFVVAYSTCQKFFGLVARPVTAAGVPIGKPINLPLPGGGVGGFISGRIHLAARGAKDFLVVTEVVNTTNTPVSGVYISGVRNGKVLQPVRAAVNEAVDIAASSTGYLLLYRNGTRLFAQELDLNGAPQGAAVAVSGNSETAVAGAVASLPGRRWIAVARERHGEGEACRESLVGTVLANE